MASLKDLYLAIGNLRKLNLPIGEELKQEVYKREDELLNKEILPTIKSQIEPILAEVERELVLIVEYVPNEPLSISLSRQETKIKGENEVIGDSSEKSIEKTSSEISQRSNIELAVMFADGLTLEGKGKQTFIRALKHMSLQRVATFDGRSFAGFPLVGRKQRVTNDGYRWQEQVDGWWIYTNMSNNTKATVLQQVADYLNIKLTIKIYGSYDKSEGKSKERGKREMYSLNGSGPLNKRNAVYETIRKFIEFKPGVTYEDVVQFFPKKLQGNYGVVISENEYKLRLAKGQDVATRYFLNKPFEDRNGKKFFVCNQWGDNFKVFKYYVIETLGWSLKEI